jgi:phage host-nuclease inhibitor protein Gam
MLPDPYRPGRVALSRQEEKALARQSGVTARELMELDHVELVERAKVRVIGGVAREAIREAEDIADEVMACQSRNPYGAHLAADLAEVSSRLLKERIERANRRLG